MSHVYKIVTDVQLFFFAKQLHEIDSTFALPHPHPIQPRSSDFIKKRFVLKNRHHLKNWRKKKKKKKEKKKDFIRLSLMQYPPF